MSRPPSPNQAARLVDAALDGERIAAVALETIQAGASDPDHLLRAVTKAFAIDGVLIPPGPALRSACRKIQKRLEASYAPA